MELKQAANTEHRKKFHLLQRLGKAAKHAGDLLRLCDHSNRCDARTRLEIQVRPACVGGWMVKGSANVYALWSFYCSLEGARKLTFASFCSP